MAINFDHQRDRISTSSGTLTLNTTGAFTIPVGNTAQRPSTLSTGQIRFNSQQQTFEGYNGAGWSSLGGVRDVDGNTYIIAETSPGVNNNEIDFYTDGTQRMQIGATGIIAIGDTLTEFTIDGSTGDTTVGGNLQVNGTLTVDGIATLKAGTSGTINVGDDNTDNVVFNADVNSNVIPNTDATYDLGSTSQNWNVAYVQTLDSNTETITVDVTGSLVLPVGTVAERPGAPTRGMIRYNSDDTTFEGYDGTAWGSLGGVKDVDQDTYISAEDSPGSDNDELDFYTAGVQRMTIGSTGQITAAATYTPTNAQDLVTKDWVETSLSAGTPTDGTWQDGAYLGFADTDKVVDILDELNESLENVRNNTFVRSVTFTANPTSGGEGTTVTLNLNVDGNANEYDIVWGDGGTTTGTSDSTPSHTYTSNANSPYTVTVRAYNNNAISGSAGSESSVTNTDYIIIYTADPVMAFALYRTSAGGSPLIGNNLYVIEGDSLYMENNTTNTTMADVTYSMDWGDGSSVDNIANDNADGGVLGNRLQHTWAVGTNTGTSLDTLLLTLDSHTTADPAVIPDSTTLNLKVYDPTIAAPDGLSTKTIAGPSSVGTSPLLASSFIDNTSGTTLTAGTSVTRVTKNSGLLESSETATYAYDGDSGILTALVNDADDGNITLTSGSQADTYTSLILTSEADYNLLDSSGSSVSFNSSIYHPGLYKGFKAKVAKNASAVADGVNSFQLSHSTTGNTNKAEFVKDTLTATPTVTQGTITENTGNYKYISGIPYYDTGSSLTWSGITVNNFIGQTYRNTTSVVTVSSGTNQESTTQNSVDVQNYSYADIDGSTTFLTGGIPNANTGNGTPYSIGDLTVNIISSSVRTVETIQVNANNVNGSGLAVVNGQVIQVHTAAQSGISEIAIDVSSSLGSTYTDDGVRIFNFSAATTNNPVIPAATNFYTNNLYTEAADPGVAGTQEATIRLGRLEHNVTNYTSYLPAGPDRSSDTGTQYFTFAFRRTVVANFTINITSATGVSGVWIAAPGTAIDNASTINGWLDCGIQYAGSGVPGADTGNGGNGSNGCAVTGGDIIANNTALSGGYTMTLGTENLTNATGNVALVRIALNTNQSITGLSIT